MRQLGQYGAAAALLRLSCRSIVFTAAFNYNAPTEVRVRLGVRHGKEPTGRRGKDTMNGAESLVRTLVGGGVNVCFTNPGTSEMHFVAALDKVDGMRCVLALFEGVVTGAADGYWRMAESRQQPCCIWDQDWGTGWPIYTMPKKPTQGSSTSLASTLPTISSTTRP